MAVNILKDRNTSSVGVLTLGATKEQGGTRTHTVTVGGDAALPFLHFEGAIPNKPVIAMEVVDRVPEEWDDLCKEPFGDDINSQMCIRDRVSHAGCGPWTEL